MKPCLFLGDVVRKCQTCNTEAEVHLVMIRQTEHCYCSECCPVCNGTKAEVLTDAVGV